MTAAENGCCGGRASNSTYVKVKMEGVVIARKIDISIHQSFETLTTTLMTMFDIFDENRRSFKLTYQDKEGDWLIAEDVPWRTFVRSLKCLKLIRSRGYQLGSTSNYKKSSAMFLLP
ncbi:auxin-responsive protein IAA29 [Gossypium hirsutum]|nr:auxin-responsive protein IAA29-like [Gossypium hirsutum]